MRYTSTQNDSNSKELYLANKAKINSDNTVIGVPNSQIEAKTTTAENTRDKFIDGKKINSPLPPFVANNIRSTHFQIGPGGQPRPTECQDSFARLNTANARQSLQPERI